MSDLESALPAVVFIVLLLVLVAVLTRGRERAVEAAGFEVVEAPEQEVRELAERLLAQPLVRCFRSERDGGAEKPWLLELEPGTADGPNLWLLVYRFAGAAWPEVALFRTGRMVPAALRRASGGAFARLEPAGGELEARLAGTPWFAFRDPQGEAAPELAGSLHLATRVPGESALLGIAVRGPFLAVWNDGRLKKLLAAGPEVRAVVRSAIERSPAAARSPGGDVPTETN